MAEKNEGREARGSGEGLKKRYEQPEITWEEAYKPAAFGISCAKQAGNISCASGPIST
jgi:hypothetical protein